MISLASQRKDSVETLNGTLMQRAPKLVAIAGGGWAYPLALAWTE